MNKITFSQCNTPLDIIFKDKKIGVIRSARYGFYVDMNGIYWHFNGIPKPITAKGGFNIGGFKRLYMAKAAAVALEDRY